MSSPTTTSWRRHAAFWAGIALSAIVLTGCAPEGIAPPSPQDTAATSAAGEGSTPAEPVATAAPAPVFVPAGDAAANLPIFRSVVDSVWAGPDQAQGRAYIDALVAAGFTDKTAMQLTADQTQIGNRAESIQFSVHWAGQCLIGQVGPATGSPRAEIAPELSDGTCLISKTRPIDW